jgi:hypothetical protein
VGVELVEGGHPGAEGGQDAERVTVALRVVLDVEAFEGGVGGLEEEDAEAGVGGVGDLGLSAVELVEEGGVLFPVVQGVAMDAEDGGDGGDGFPGGK